MTTERKPKDIQDIRTLVVEVCTVLVDASKTLWAELDTHERAMLRGFVVAQEWEVPKHPAVLRTYIQLENLGLVTGPPESGGGVETTVFAEAMVSIMDSEGEG